MVLDVASGVVTHVRTRGSSTAGRPTEPPCSWRETPNGERPAGLRWVKVASESWTAVSRTTSVPNKNFTLSTSVTVSRTGEIAWVGRASTRERPLSRVPAAGGTPSVLWAPSGCVLAEPRVSPTGTEIAVGLGGASCAAGKDAALRSAVGG